MRDPAVSGPQRPRRPARRVALTPAASPGSPPPVPPAPRAQGARAEAHAVDLVALRSQLLRAREARQELIRRLCAELPLPETGAEGSRRQPDGRLAAAATDRRSFWSLLFAGTSIPGPVKNPGGLADMLHRSVQHLAGPGGVLARNGRGETLRRLGGGCDALGPYEAWAVPREAAPMKETTVRLEEGAAWGRLLDLDIYDRQAEPVGRRELGLPPRCCLLCGDAAVDCIRTGRHTPDQLQTRVMALLSGLDTVG
jgi:holo-ACP synthase